MKAYRLKRLTFLQTEVKVGDEVKKVVFKNGRVSPFAGGVFITEDTDIQKALEARKDFGTKFAVDTKTTGKYKKIAANRKPEKAKDTAPEEGGDEPKVYEEATTVQQASEILAEEYGIPKSTVRNKESVLKKADELNITFPNI